MICSRCGRQIQDSTTFCPYCGQTFTYASPAGRAAPYGANNAYANVGANNQNYRPQNGYAPANPRAAAYPGYTQPAYPNPGYPMNVAPKPAKKNKKTIIIALTVVAVIAIGLVLFFTLSSSNSLVGKWESPYTSDVIEFKRNGTYVIEDDDEHGYYKVDGDRITIYDEDHDENVKLYFKIKNKKLYVGETRSILETCIEEDLGFEKV